MTMQAIAMATTSPISSPPTSPPPTPYIPYTPLASSPYSALPPSPYANFPPSPYAQFTPSSYTISSSVTSNPGLNHQLKTAQTSRNTPEQVQLYLITCICVMACKNNLHAEILLFSTIYSSENFPECKYVYLWYIFFTTYSMWLSITFIKVTD